MVFDRFENRPIGSRRAVHPFCLILPLVPGRMHSTRQKEIHIAPLYNYFELNH